MPHTPSRAIQHSRFVNGSPVFYGWVIALVGTLGAIMTSPGQTYSVSIFLEYFITDLGISRALVSTLYTIGTLVGSFALPVVGRQIDQHGARRTMVVISVLFGLACIYMGFVNNAIMLGAGFVAIRMLGQGSLTLVSQNAINQWWVRRRGMMLGFSGMMVSLLGLGTFPNIINWLIPIYGWRVTYILLGAILLLVMAPLGLLFVRNRPEQYGLQPDGAPTPLPGDSAAPVAVAEENWTLGEAMRTPIFWSLAVGLALIAMLGTGLIFHIVSIFADNGLSSTVAASVFVPLAITTAAVNLASSFLVNRIPMRLLMAGALILLTISLLMAQFLPGVELAFIYGMIIGATFGLMNTVQSVSWPMYYGRRHLGSITGFIATILTAGSALGPMPLGIARDALGSYNTTLTIAAIFPLALAIITPMFDRPKKQGQG